MGWFEESHSQWVNGWNGRSSALHSIWLYIQHPLVICLAWNNLERTYDTSWEEIMLSIRSIAQKAGGIHTVLRILGDASEHWHKDHRIDRLCWSLSNISQVLSGSIYKHSWDILFSMEETLHFTCSIPQHIFCWCIWSKCHGSCIRRKLFCSKVYCGWVSTFWNRP